MIHGVLLALDLSAVDFTPIVEAIEGCVPGVLTGVIPIVGIRKCISFLMGAIRGA